MVHVFLFLCFPLSFFPILILSNTGFSIFISVSVLQQLVSPLRLFSTSFLSNYSNFEGFSARGLGVLESEIVAQDSVGVGFLLSKNFQKSPKEGIV